MSVDTEDGKFTAHDQRGEDADGGDNGTGREEAGKSSRGRVRIQREIYDRRRVAVEDLLELIDPDPDPAD